MEKECLNCNAAFTVSEKAQGEKILHIRLCNGQPQKENQSMSKLRC